MSKEIEPIVFSEIEPKAVDILYVAGEHSGDQHAAEIARDIRELRPELKQVAMGGPALAAEGVLLLHDLTATSVVGLIEVLKHYDYFKDLFDKIVDWIEQHQPKIVVLVDYPGFNLRLAEALKMRKISKKGGGSVAIFQYISPQIWAWKAKRRFRMADLIDELGVIFPFEVACYDDTDLKVDFIGHPFVHEDYVNPVFYDASGPILALPGSRVQAVTRILPVILNGIAAFGHKSEMQKIVILYPNEQIREVIEGILTRFQDLSEFIELRLVGEPIGVKAVLMSSGTMSLNCALAGIPGGIVYYAHPVTYWLGKMLVSIKWLGIANLVLDKEMYPEFIQYAASNKALAACLKDCLTDSSLQKRFFEDAEKLRTVLSAPAKETPAECVLRCMGV